MPLTGERKREYDREWVRKRREQFFDGKSCVECGSIDRLELDHIDRATKVSHKIWSWSEARRNEELAKCQVLCHDCHLSKTAKENTRPVTHGTRAGYEYHKCRCDSCHEAYLAAWREYRLLNPRSVVVA